MLKAKLPTAPVHKARNYAGEKETIGTYRLVAYRKGAYHNPVVVKVYMGRSAAASTVYASIWVNTASGVECQGTGSASGYGYHKASAAIDSAIRCAGITLTGDPYGQENTRKPTSIAGVGDSAIRAAIEAIGRACGYQHFTIA